MKKIDGFLDLDDYLSNLDDSENYIKEVKGGTFIDIDGISYFFKSNDLFYEPYYEVVGSYIADKLEIKNTPCDFAIYKKNKGIIAKDYRKEGHEYISGYDILNDYYDKNENNFSKMNYSKSNFGPNYSSINTLEVIEKALHSYFGDKYDITGVLNDLNDLYMYSLLLWDSDRGPHNWEIDQSDKEVKLVPLFDRGAIFDKTGVTMFGKDFNDLNKSFEVAIKNYLDEASTNEKKLFIKRFKLLRNDNIKYYLECIEKDKHLVLPDSFKKVFLDNVTYTYNTTLEILKDLNLIVPGKLKRIIGYIDFDEYYTEKLGTSNYSIEVLEEMKDVTVLDGQYLLYTDVGSYYFKIPKINFYGEIIAGSLASLLSINLTNYDLGFFNGEYGNIIPDYHRNKCKYISGDYILKDYIDNNHLKIKSINFKNLNDLEFIWQALDERYPNSNSKKVIDKLIDMYIFNILTMQYNNFDSSWKIEESEDGINFISLFDNETIYYDVYDDKKLMNNIENSLKMFLSLSSSEYIENFLNKYYLLSGDMIMEAFSMAEDVIGTEIDDDIKEKMFIAYVRNHDKIKEVIKNLKLDITYGGENGK